MIKPHINHIQSDLRAMKEHAEFRVMIRDYMLHTGTGKREAGSFPRLDFSRAAAVEVANKFIEGFGFKRGADKNGLLVLTGILDGQSYEAHIGKWVNVPDKLYVRVVEID